LVQGTAGAGRTRSTAGQGQEGAPPVKRARREGPSPVAPAVAAIRAGKVKVRTDGHLELPRNIEWPIATNYILFKRFFFDDFFKHVLHECKMVDDPTGDGTAYRKVVSGQPGIGKSVYGWYIIYRILTEQPQRAIVYISDSLEAAFVLHPDGRTEETTSVSHELVASLYDPVVIADSVVPKAYKVPTIIISSPGRLNDRILTNKLNYFDERDYLPIPTLEEMNNMAEVLHPHLDKAGIEERIAKWGHIPRFVFVKISAKQQAKRLRDIVDLPLEKLKKALRNSSTIEARDASHTVLGEYPTGQIVPGQKLKTSDPKYYSFGGCQFLSDYVGALVMDTALKAGTFETQFFVDATAQIAGVATLNGTFLEVIGKLWLMDGDTTMIRKLSGGRDAKQPAKNITIPKLPAVQFTNVTELTAKKRTSGIFIPAKSNQVSFDAIVWDPAKKLRLFINFTKNRKHGLHVAGLYEVVKALGYTDATGWPGSAGNKTVDFAFGVPKGVMETLGMQTFTDVGRLEAFKKNINQQALLIPSKWSDVKGAVPPTNSQTGVESKKKAKGPATRK
jgi:hypothetical protein